MSHLGILLPVVVLSLLTLPLFICSTLPDFLVMEFNSLLLALVINTVPSFAVKFPFRRARGSAFQRRSTASVSKAVANSLASGGGANDFDVKYVQYVLGDNVRLLNCDWLYSTVHDLVYLINVSNLDLMH